jgi:hypothetical protein
LLLTGGRETICEAGLISCLLAGGIEARRYQILVYLRLLRGDRGRCPGGFLRRCLSSRRLAPVHHESANRATDQCGNQGNWKKFVCHNHRSALLKHIACCVSTKLTLQELFPCCRVMVKLTRVEQNYSDQYRKTGDRKKFTS